VLVQEFLAWKQSRGVDFFALPARMAIAFYILENELKLETKSEQY
jgi:hypothetical protein